MGSTETATSGQADPPGRFLKKNQRASPGGSVAEVLLQASTCRLRLGVGRAAFSPLGSLLSDLDPVKQTNDGKLACIISRTILMTTSLVTKKQ